MNEAPKPVMVWYVVEGLTVMTWLCELDPGANVAPVCGASSWLWLVVVSVTETAGPDAACAPAGAHRGEPGGDERHRAQRCRHAFDAGHGPP